jgi:DNA polymerase III subunit epsilon
MNHTFVALDFETANSSHSSACEIGIVKVMDGLIVEKFYSLIKPPENNYAIANILIHGINSDLTKASPSFDEIWPKIKEFIGDNLIVAHNISFDATILYHTLDYYSIDAPEYQGACTFEIYRRSLTEICQAFGIERQYHNALIDAEACAMVYLNHLKGIKPDFLKINTQEKSSLFDFTGHDKIKGNLLKPDFEHGDSECPFYKRKVVITGVFTKISRQELATILKEKGADIDTSVTDKTNYLIAGADPGPSKIRKFEVLHSKGNDIKLIYEDDFLEIINTYNCNS